MASSKDTDKKQAQSWVNPEIANIDSNKISENDVFIDAIKTLVINKIQTERSDKNDAKYRNIADLIMLRVQTDIKNSIGQLSFNQFNDDFKYAVIEHVKYAFDNYYGQHDKMSFSDIAGLISSAIEPHIKKQEQIDLKPAEPHIPTDEIHTELLMSKPAQYKASNAKNIKHTKAKHKKAKAKNNYRIAKTKNTLALTINQQCKSLQHLCITNVKAYNQTFEKLQLPIQQTTIPKSIKRLLNTTNRQAKKSNANSDAQSIQQFSDNEIEDKRVNATKQKYAKTIKYNKLLFNNIDQICVLGILNIIDGIQAAHTKIKRKLDDIVLSKKSIFAQYTKTITKSLDELYALAKGGFFKWLIEQLSNRFLTNMFKTLGGQLIDLFNGITQPILEKFSPILTKFTDKVKSVTNGLKAAFKLIWKVIRKTIKIAWKGFQIALKGITTSIKLFLKGLWTGLKAAWVLIKMLLSGIWKFMKFIGKGLGKILDKITGNVFSKIGKAVGKVFDKLKSKLSKIRNAFRKGLDKIKNFFKKGLDKIKNAIKNAAKKVVDAIKKAVKKVIKKIVSAIKNFVKKIVKTIAKKIGKMFAKKVAKKAAQSLLKVAAKKLMGFLKKWIIKIITKFIIKMAGSTAVNAIPILGQIISAGLIIYNVIDTIITFWQLYTFFKENPAAFDYIKEEIVKFVKKSLNFIDGLCKAGKEFFIKYFIEGPKKMAKLYAHGLNFLLNPFSTMERLQKRAKYANELLKIRNEELEALAKLSAEDRAKLINKRWKSNIKEINALQNKAQTYTDKITSEEKSWWPSSKSIVGWMDARQAYFRLMARLAAQIGLTDFSKEAVKQADDMKEQIEREAAERERLRKQLEARRKELRLKYSNKRIDLDALNEICQKWRSEQNMFTKSVEELKNNISSKSAHCCEILEELCDSNDEAENEDVFAA